MTTQYFAFLILISGFLCDETNAGTEHLQIKLNKDEKRYVEFDGKQYFLGKNGVYETTFKWKDCVVFIDLQPYVEGVGDEFRQISKTCRSSYPQYSAAHWEEYMNSCVSETEPMKE